jgi:nucleotide-binding universal stress UspA family protein
MKIVVAVDWSDQALNAVQEVCNLYEPKELTLVHAVDLGLLESPVMAQAMNLQGYDDFRKGMLDAGQQLMEQTAKLVPPAVPSVKQVCKLGRPARVVLDAVASAAADLVVVGSRGRGRMAELMLGSVSHRILQHAPCSTLIVKRPLKTLRKALVAVEGPDDSIRLREWLHTHPFLKPVDLDVISVVPTPHAGDPVAFPYFPLWNETATNFAKGLARDLARSLDGARYRASHQVFQGRPADVIGRESAAADLLIVGSHSRKGVDRFLLGSVSHAVSHRAACSVLVVR